jgi:GNAT superfamily N-acetyltransferase
MEKGHIHIRTAHKTERHAILDLVSRAYAEFGTVLSPSLWTSYQEDIVATIEEENLAERIVAVQDDAIVGSVLLYPKAAATTSTYPGNPISINWPEVRLLAVSPESRKQGVATALLNECIQRASATGASVLGLHTTDFMPEAIHLYERSGFMRAPEADFRVMDILVKSYHLPLSGSSGQL